MKRSNISVLEEIQPKRCLLASLSEAFGVLTLKLFIYLFILFSARAKRVLVFFCVWGCVCVCHGASTSEASAVFFFVFSTSEASAGVFFVCVCVSWGQHERSECCFFFFFQHERSECFFFFMFCFVLFYLCYETRMSEASVFFFFFSAQAKRVLFFFFQHERSEFFFFSCLVLFCFICVMRPARAKRVFFCLFVCFSARAKRVLVFFFFFFFSVFMKSFPWV